MTRKQLFILLFLNLLIASSFFVKNLGVGYTQLSGDMQNIVPMCMKLDDASLYPNDLYLSDTNNFKFYTPFFIETLRFFTTFTNKNFIQATNILLFLSSLLFGILWFLLLFKIFIEKFWVALLISILMRGIVWLPMGEIWGISDLWTLMPRTFYVALMPIPFLLILLKRPLFYLASFLIGLIFNFHPISGLGGILIFTSIVFCCNYFKYTTFSKKHIIVGLAMILLGMLPFIFTYFGKTETALTYDINAFNAAFNAKISSKYQEVNRIFQAWIEFKFLFFLVPVLIFTLYSFFKNNTYQKQAIILIITTLLLFFLPVLSIYFEQFINETFHINLRMSFQLVRIQKLAILPGYFAMGYLLMLFFEKHQNYYKYLPVFFWGYMVILLFSTPTTFKNIPFLGDDISSSILPGISEVLKPISERKTDADKMADYIQKNTPITAVFYKNFYLRSAAKRSVKFDGKGANILIEGNPQKLIEWHSARIYLKNASIEEQLAYLKQAGVHYIVSQNRAYPLPVKKQIGNYKLYLIN